MGWINLAYHGECADLEKLNVLIKKFHKINILENIYYNVDRK